MYLTVNITCLRKYNSISNRPPTINADNQHIEYNSFNKVTQITEEDPVTGIILRQLNLVYGAGNQRVFQQMQNEQNVTTKYYVGSDYEVENKDGVITRVHYISTPSGLAAIVRCDEQNNDELNFVLNDHLGSVQVLADAAGQLLEEFSYDPWGQRRNPVTLEVYAWAAMPEAGMDYGFTGHEHLDIFMLVNMNGRIYDPTIGRFLSPDPVLQFPNFTQGLNPYAYALNNPLRFVDPEGYSLVGQLIAISVQIAFTSVGLPMVGVLAYSVIMTIDYAIEQGRNVKAGDLFGYFMQTFVMSAISVGVTQGIGAYYNNLSGVQKSAIELRRALAHGTFNGAMRMAQGGKFEHGFMSGFVSSLGGSFIQANADNMSLGAKVSMSAVIGGTAEKLGGGKFANGAVTGAYVMMFNHLHDRQKRNVPSKEWMEKKANELIEWEKTRVIKTRNGYSVYDDLFDLHYEGYENFSVTRERHLELISLEIEGQYYDVYFEYHPAVDSKHNQVTSIRESGIAGYYGLSPMLKGMNHIQIWSVTSSKNHFHIGSLYMNKDVCFKIWNYIYNLD